MENLEAKSKSLPANQALALAASLASIVLGLWLLLAPLTFNYTGKGLSFWNDIIFGTLTAAVASFRLFFPLRSNSLSWVNVGLGFWLMIAPYILSSFSLFSKWNDIIAGFIVILLGTWSAVSVQGG